MQPLLIHHESRLLWYAVPAGLIVVLLLAGCAPKYHDYEAFIIEPKPMVTSTEYRLAPPDVITIRSMRVREIHGQSERIRPDGKITLPLIGSVFIAGMTPEEVGELLTARAREFYEDADVNVHVTVFASKQIFVFGEVGSPGPYPYHGRNTVLEMMAYAQPTRLADPSRVQILRPSADGEVRRRMTINLDEMVKRGDTSLDAVLEEGDIIYVPPNPLAAVGLGFQQLLLPLQPAAATVKGPAQIEQSATGTASYGSQHGY